MYNLISYLLHPYVFFLLFLGLATARLWIKHPELRRRLLVLVVPLLSLVVLSIPAVSYLAVGSLEWQYEPLYDRPKEVEAIVVLEGGGLPPDRGRKQAELAPASLFRTIHAARLYHQGNPCLILVTGGNTDPDIPGPPFVELMAELLRELGVRADDLLVERNSRSTYENAIESRKMLKERGINHIVLVTDAIHLPRAVRCFRKQGFQVVPSGCNYRATEFKYSTYQVLPAMAGISSSEGAAHEWIGLLWYWVAGRV